MGTHPKNGKSVTVWSHDAELRSCEKISLNTLLARENVHIIINYKIKQDGKQYRREKRGS